MPSSHEKQWYSAPKTTAAPLLEATTASYLATSSLELQRPLTLSVSSRRTTSCSGFIAMIRSTNARFAQVFEWIPSHVHEPQPTLRTFWCGSLINRVLQFRNRVLRVANSTKSPKKSGNIVWEALQMASVRFLLKMSSRAEPSDVALSLYCIGPLPWTKHCLLSSTLLTSVAGASSAHGGAGPPQSRRTISMTSDWLRKPNKFSASSPAWSRVTSTG
mmetsp:Transcript_92379/g.260965  ORF Transcript_92379/g.260965 Transcript_92379/m.260965 type:complete len:217 (-) Transcript_92379:123-773(-)